MIWHAVHEWVRRYASLFYRGDADVKGDAELQAWAAELSSFEGGRVPGFGSPEGTIGSLEYLVEVLARVVFTCSAQHAAVNFSQKMMADPSRFPLAGYAPVPRGKGATAGDVLAFLPPLDQALRQLNILTLLCSILHNRLGDYGGAFEDVRVEQPLRDFQAALSGIEQTIDNRNLHRVSYPFLKPSLIPRSINI
jgi:arachidonate 15-lipoxygenase